MRRILSRPRTLLLALVAGALCAGPAAATWSIVLVNHRTGEVAVASATCIPNNDLKTGVPVVWVGGGAGAAQAQLDGTGTNRRILRNGLLNGLTPQEILTNLIQNGIAPGTRQYGIAAFTGPAVTFTGGQAGLAKAGVTGSTPDGEITYAIQGNVLTGDEVVDAAEAALLAAKGDTGQRLLAGMFGARSLGGDGRCSCAPLDPTGCGVPPPSFTKSAHVGFLIVARMGDTNGNCQAFTGCANGDYYMCLNVIGGQNDPDPVFELADALEDFRDALSGRPDAIRTRVTPSASALPADGRTTMTVHLELRDLDDVPLSSGGATIGVAPADPNETPLVRPGGVTDHGDGTYTLDLVAGTTTGTQELAISVDDGVEEALLFPYTTVRLDPVSRLHAGEDDVSAAAGASVPLTLNVPSAAEGPFALLASASGTQPGIPLGSVTLPLNPDDLLFHTAKGGSLAGSPGFLDAAGHAQATWTMPPGLLAQLLGSRVSWAGLAFDGASLVVTNVAELDVVP